METPFKADGNRQLELSACDYITEDVCLLSGLNKAELFQV